MRAFVIRPFGIKSDIDFDRVERELISPALAALQVEGRGTLEILRQGNIRHDMFQRLLTADLVIADVSIHNANVFYELGIRHALREKRTFLLRSEGDTYPFDLQTDRYLAYDRNDPGSRLPVLIEALRQTLASTAQDSPVFDSLPDLQEQKRSSFLAVPRDFREAVEQAAAKGLRGDLEMLAEEVRGFDWEIEGLRVVGRAQFEAKAIHGAQRTWEAVRSIDGDDLEASLLLGTLHERLGDLVTADQALRRVIESRRATPTERTEALTLLARNAKTCWRREWESLPREQWRQEALRSRYLDESLEAYEAAFKQNLNHFYPGLNALGLLKVQTDLARELPEVWAATCEDPNVDAASQLAQKGRQSAGLVAAVGLSIAAARARLELEHQRDVWVDFSEADFALLTSERPARVAIAFKRAIAGAPAFAVEAARNQILLYQRLEVFAANVTAALREFPPLNPAVPASEPGRILLFTGHMIDEPGRQPPRFPATPQAEAVARAAIRGAIVAERECGPVAFGIAGGASGGDLLFHEVCAELEIPTRLYLALPPDQYVVESVKKAGPDWVERFNRLCGHHPETRVLGSSKNLPNWLAERAVSYGFWQRNSRWLLCNALAERETAVTLLALWDGKAGDGPGGTKDLLEDAAGRGAKTVVLNTTALFGTIPEGK